MIQKFKSYALEKWVEGEGQGQVILHAVTGEPLGEVSSRGLDFKAMLNYARTIGGPGHPRHDFPRAGPAAQKYGEVPDRA